MEWIKDPHWRMLIRKYRYIPIFLLLGIALMVFPKEEPPVREPEILQETGISLQETLSVLLSKVSGAGKVEVLLTEASGSETYYQEDIETRGSEVRRDTVLVTNGSREETGLVRRTDPPIYRGAVILCQGADSAQVRLALVEAVKHATGLSSDRITVLKMK